MNTTRRQNDLAQFLATGIARLEREDPQLFRILSDEYRRQANVLTMVASSSIADPAALVCEAMPTMNVTAEGYPARALPRRLPPHRRDRAARDRPRQAGLRRVLRQRAADVGDLGQRDRDVQRARAGRHADGARARLRRAPDARLEGLDLRARSSTLGRLRPDARTSASTTTRPRALAKEHRPKLIVCGTTAYPRQVDWARFRAIADEVGAYLSPTSRTSRGLVAAGLHPRPSTTRTSPRPARTSSSTAGAAG